MRFEKTSPQSFAGRLKRSPVRDRSSRPQLPSASSAVRSVGAWLPTTPFHRTRFPMVRTLCVPRAPHHLTKSPMVHLYAPHHLTRLPMVPRGRRT